MSRVGIMGGTFDPIHYGHLTLADQVRVLHRLDKIIFIPTGHPPHKSTTDSNHRYQMVSLAIQNNEHFELSDIEVKRQGKSYTIETIEMVKNQMKPSDELYFITGADSLMTLGQWKSPEKLLQSVRFIAAVRPGVDLKKFITKIDEFKRQYGADIDMTMINAMSVSATEIRENFDLGESNRYMLPDSVIEYATRYDLYRTHHPSYVQLKQILKKKLSQKRFQHSLGVSDMARILAVHHGIDYRKAELAGLVHDIAKEIKNSEMKQWIKKSNIYVDASIQHDPNLAHGEVGAFLLQELYGMTDEEILEAVRWHTYGAENMSALSKIVFLADIFEPNRGVSKKREEIKQQSFQSLNRAILYYCQLEIEQLKQKQLAIHPNMMAMMQQIKGEINHEDDIR